MFKINPRSRTYGDMDHRVEVVDQADENSNYVVPDDFSLGTPRGCTLILQIEL